MFRSAHFRSHRRSPVWLLAIGLFAMAMHAFGSAGLMPRSVASGGFLAEICTSKGVSKIDPALQSGKTSLPDSGHQDCCTLCVASGESLPVDLGLGVPPAPTFGSTFLPGTSPFSPAFARLSHPPRGPPLV